MSEDPGLKDLKTWSIAECGKIFASSIDKLKSELKNLSEGDNLLWDKDNKEAMDFVAACANIRAYIFGIPQKTRFDIKCKYNLSLIFLKQLFLVDKPQFFYANVGHEFSHITELLELKTNYVMKA